MKNLVIVESPSKAKTIEKFLGKNYKVLASVGHIRDLPKSTMGIDIENDFEPKYINIRGKGPIIKELKKAANNSKNIYLATDPDREGEAIAWHISNILELDELKNNRIIFREITKDTVKNAIKNAKPIDKKLVDSQQARRILDRLVGYEISPILWRKVMRGLSAGRVQSIATRLVVLKEEEIKAFKPVEYWNASIELIDNKNKIIGEIIEYNSKKFKVDNTKDAKKIENILKKEKFILSDIQKKTRYKNPPKVFTTSTLQQEASSRLNFTAYKTMSVAQKLYEGKRIKGGTVGLITYMRTDSTRVSDEAQKEVKQYINDTFSKEYVGSYTHKTKEGSQDAHEGIRVTSIYRTPTEIESYLTRDEFRLYKLIWERYLASLMKKAKILATTYNSRSEKFLARTKGEIVEFDGYLKVYTYGNVKDVILPLIEEGTKFKNGDIKLEQKFTQPPLRYTEASLIKDLEDKGIGRPSTYAPTISTILKRSYVQKEKKFLLPTELGYITNNIMQENFLEVVETDFTRELEQKLDDIASGKIEWKNIIREFYKELKPLLDKAEDNIKKYDLSELTDIDCEKCGNKMLIKKTVKGNFYACSNYPECKNTKSILKEIGIHCPDCKDGQIVERKTRKLKIFYGCNKFPECKFASWTKPINSFCKKCGNILTLGNGKMSAFILCSNKECDFKIKKSEFYK